MNSAFATAPATLCALFIILDQVAGQLRGIRDDRDSEIEKFQQIIRRYEARSKREVTQVKLDDPGQCVKRCTEKESKLHKDATRENTNWLIAIGLDDAKDHFKGWDDDEDATRQRLKEFSLRNMGPLFEEMCEIAIDTDDCLRKCPDSTLKLITIANRNSAELYCEPSKHWKDFKAYYDATACNNRTIAKKPCDSKCGPVLNITSTTQLDLHQNVIKYEKDVKKNTGSAASACRSVQCHTECLQPIMTKECGENAYDVFQRLSRLEPKSVLSTMKILDIIDPVIPDCAIYVS